MDYQEAINIFEIELDKLNTRPIHVKHLQDVEKAQEAMRTAICAMKKIQEYKKQEEDGLLIKLPCQPGTRVYEVYHFLPDGFVIDGVDVMEDLMIDEHVFRIKDIQQFGISIFLTFDEAREKIKEMRERIKENDT